MAKDQSAPNETASFESVIEELAETMPDVQEHVIENEREKEEAQTGQRDKGGNLFDPEIHDTHADGSPKFTQAGNFAKKRGRKAGQGNTTSNTSKVSTGQPAPLPPADLAAIQTGKGAAQMVFTVGQILGGEEWQPIYDEKTGLDEKEMMESAWIDYAKAKGMRDLPAGVVLSFVMLAYAGPRFAMPKTKTRMQKLKENIGGRIGRWKASRGNAKGKNRGVEKGT